MLSFDIRSLETRAVHVDGSLEPDDPIWEAGDARPAGPVRVTGRLSSAGEGRFYFAGRVEGHVELPCRLCLDEGDVEVDEEVHLLLAELGGEEGNDPAGYPSDPSQRMP